MHPTTGRVNPCADPASLPECEHGDPGFVAGSSGQMGEMVPPATAMYCRPPTWYVATSAPIGATDPDSGAVRAGEPRVDVLARRGRDGPRDAQVALRQ